MNNATIITIEVSKQGGYQFETPHHDIRTSRLTKMNMIFILSIISIHLETRLLKNGFMN